MSSVVKVIQPFGLLDRTKSGQFHQEINNCLEAGANLILIDFKDVTFMDSSGLGAVVLAIKTVQSAGQKIFVCGLNHQVRMLFELAGLDKVIEIFENQDQFKSKVVT